MKPNTLFQDPVSTAYGLSLGGFRVRRLRVSAGRFVRVWKRKKKTQENRAADPNFSSKPQEQKWWRKQSKANREEKWKTEKRITNRKAP